MSMRMRHIIPSDQVMLSERLQFIFQQDSLHQHLISVDFWSVC